MSDFQGFEGLAYAALLLERQLDSYEKLHAEEIRALREALNELKHRILTTQTAVTHENADDAHQEGE
ncbi:MAG: hypothetical protein Fur0018_09580 [Anaerolineales bacterium]